jgi:prophage regulatory protein
METKYEKEARVTTILRLPQVLQRTSLSRSGLYPKVSDGTFPRPISLGARAVGWIESDVEGWIAYRIALSRGEFKGNTIHSEALRTMENQTAVIQWKPPIIDINEQGWRITTGDTRGYCRNSEVRWLTRRMVLYPNMRLLPFMANALTGGFGLNAKCKWIKRLPHLQNMFPNLEWRYDNEYL